MTSTSHLTQTHTTDLGPDAHYPYAGDYGTNRYWWAAMRSLGDLSMSCPSREWKRCCSVGTFPRTQNPPFSLLPGFASRRFHELSRGKSWTYFFNHTRSDSQFPVVNHASEIAFVMRMPWLIGDDGIVADALASWWGNFASHLNPNGIGEDSLPKWLPFSQGASKDEIMAIGVPPPLSTVTGLKKKACAIMEPFLRREVAKFR